MLFSPFHSALPLPGSLHNNSQSSGGGSSSSRNNNNNNNIRKKPSPKMISTAAWMIHFRSEPFSAIPAILTTSDGSDGGGDGKQGFACYSSFFSPRPLPYPEQTISGGSLLGLGLTSLIRGSDCRSSVVMKLIKVWT